MLTEEGFAPRSLRSEHSQPTGGSPGQRVPTLSASYTKRTRVASRKSPWNDTACRLHGY